jgi:outer membrane protein assembly factor BamB
MATPESIAVEAENEVSTPLPLAARLRCLLALGCSHLAAPYAAARLTIRYQLQGDFEWSYAITAGVAMSLGAILAFRQLVNLPNTRKWVYGVIISILWIVVSFVLLAVAVHSDIPSAVLGTLWAGGSLWIAWTVWAYSLFHGRGVLIGSLLVGLVAMPFWVLVEATGLRGDTRVEFAWRKTLDPALAVTESRAIDSTGAVTWPGYLGASRDGVLNEVTFDEDWVSHPPEKVWLQSCGSGWSSFAVTETTLFGQEQLSTGDCVTARDLATGEILWSTAEESEGFRSGLGGDGPRATPSLYSLKGEDASRLVLFAVGPTGLLSCLDASNGAVIWKADLMQLFPGEELIHGVCGSPLVVDDMVVVAPPTNTGPGLVAFDLNSGELAWKCSSDWRASYASPALMTICNRPQIIFHAGPGVMGVQPADGTVLWQYEWTNEWDNNATQPLQVEGHPNDLFVATGYKGGVARISIIEGDDGGLMATEVWSTRKTMKTKFCNLAQFGNVLVGLDNGILCGVDVKSGDRLWKKGRYGHGQMLKAGEHLLIVEEKGDVRILKPGSKGPNPVGDSIQALDRKTWSHPVLIGDRMILRNDQQVVCLRLPLVQPSQGDNQE